MKYVKMLGLLAVAAAALMAFAGTASATTLTSPTGTTYTGTIHASSEGHAILHNSFTTVECNSTVEGKVEKHGTGVTVSGKISTLHFTGCTGSNTVENPVASPGSLEIHAINCNATTKYCTGTLTSTGAAVTVTNHAFGGTCIYTTNNTDLGTVTGTDDTGSNATLDISATLPRTGGSLGVFCGATGSWTGSYKVNTPASLWIDE